MAHPDSICVSQLEVRSRIGISEAERSAPQRLTISLRLIPRKAFPALADDIAHTVDYAAVCEAVRREAESKTRNLIETLAEEVAALLLARFPLSAVEVEVRKYILPFAEYAAVEVRRES